MKKQLLSALLAGCLVVGCIGPVSAEEITTSGGDGETPVVLTAEAMTFSVTVPMALSVGVAADGTVTTADNAKIVNNSSGPVKVESVTAAAVAPWEMAAWDENDNLSGEKVSAKKFALSINGTGVAADGSCGAVFDSIAAKGELPFEYAAHVAPQATAITAEDNEQMAKVVFTIGWDEAPAVVIGEWDVSEKGNGSVMATLKSDGVITISGNGKMQHYSNTYTPYENKKDAIKTAVIKDGVTNIGYNAFQNCSSLTSINTPDGVTSIEGGAFENCSSLTSVTIPDSVTWIGGSAFAECHSLTSINIPDGVTSIESGAFKNCSSLTSINIPDSVKNMGHTVFFGCTSLTSINIPDGVTSIGDQTFRACKSLTSVTIPDSVTWIGGSAFSGCTSLTSINIPDGVTSIDQGTFANCSSLTSINIPDSVTRIGGSAFAECHSLTSINIPDSVKSIGDYAFNGGRSLIITWNGNDYSSIASFKADFTAIEGNTMGN